MPDLIEARTLVASLFLLATIAVAQGNQKTQTLSINGRAGEATIYQMGGKTYVDLESLVRIANGTMSFQGDRIVLHLPAGEMDLNASPEPSSPNLSQDFMRASLQTVTVLKDWTNTLAYGIQRGVPGDGSRMVVFHDRAADALRLAKVAAISNTDQDALQLLTNQFNTVSAWSDKLIGERKRMDTAKYSLTPDSLKNDENYQKISACTAFLSTMLSSGAFQDDYSCH
jgi:hypothetical protein